MKPDLSKLIYETIVSTITTNISYEITIKEMLVGSQQSLENKSLAVVGTNFAFTNLDFKLNILYPAQISSFIFNCIMQSDDELVDTIDDDTKDAIKEINSQIIGSLETIFNGQNYEDIATCKSEISEMTIQEGSSIDIGENLIVLNLMINDNNFELYLDFDEVGLEYIKEFTLAKKQITIIEDEDTQILDPAGIEIEEDTNEEIEIPLEPIEEPVEDEKNDEDKKDKKLKLLIMVVAGLLVFVTIVFISMYFMGIFDEKEIQKKDINTTKLSKRDIIIANIKNKQIAYTPNMIDVNKLNKRLELLTKYEILENNILEKYKIEEKERLYKLKMAKLEEFASRNKEESIFKKEINKLKRANRFDDINNSIQINEQQILDNEKLTLIEIKAGAFKRYKQFINQEKIKTTKISMCSINDKVKVYVGPIYIDILVNNLMSGMDKNDAKITIITRKEFNNRCDF
jgi:hypothetical protein